MNLHDILNRKTPPTPWAESGKIPWDEPGFSARMLQEHLSQAHDAASRRFAVIERQVDWIHRQALGGRTGRILDLACGPGLYAARLARLGHRVTGIDFSPAAIGYARSQSAGLTVEYRQEDIRRADYGSGYDLVMLIYGEFNVFSPEDARLILTNARQALAPGGRLLLEVHTFEAVHNLGLQPASWSALESGLFCAEPHLLLSESFWDETLQTATERYFVVNAASGAITRCAATTQAYTTDQYHALLKACGFSNVTCLPSLLGKWDASQRDFFVIQAAPTA